MQFGHRLLIAALVGLLVVMTGTVLLIFDVAEGLGRATVAVVLVLMAIFSVTLIPAHHAARRRDRAGKSPTSH